MTSSRSSPLCGRANRKVPNTSHKLQVSTKRGRTKVLKWIRLTSSLANFYSSFPVHFMWLQCMGSACERHAQNTIYDPWTAAEWWWRCWCGNWCRRQNARWGMFPFKEITFGLADLWSPGPSVSQTFGQLGLNQAIMNSAVMNNFGHVGHFLFKCAGKCHFKIKF